MPQKRLQDLTKGLIRIDYNYALRIGVIVRQGVTTFLLPEPVNNPSTITVWVTLWLKKIKVMQDEWVAKTASAPPNWGFGGNPALWNFRNTLSAAVAVYKRIQQH